MGNIVECIKRTYRIQTPNGIKMEVESEKLLSGATTARLLEDDSYISSFLENCKILDVKSHQEKAIFHKELSYKRKSDKNLKNKVRLKKKAKLKKKALLEKIGQEA